MKKFSKLLCVLLMLALLCTSIVFAVSAAATDTVTQVEGGNGTAMSDVTIGSVEGNALTSNANWVQYQQKTDPNGDGKYSDGEATDDNMLDAYVVMPAGSEDGYAVLAAGEKQNGGTFQNVQHTYTYNGALLTTDSYYVVDMDLATPTEAITSIAISLPNRNVSGDSWSGFPFGTNVEITKYVNLDENWIHFTVVNSMKTNKQYVFVNGEFVAVTNGNAYNASAVVEGTELHANGIKIEVAYEDSVNNSKMIMKNQSIAFDNLARRDIVDADGIAALDAIMAEDTPNLKNWAGYPTDVRTGSLPNYVRIDGVKYNNLADASNALNGNEAKSVEVLNPFPAALYVNCDATVNTNGYDVDIRPGDGATSTTEGNIITVDAPYQASMTETLSGAVTDHYNATKYSAADNLFTKYSFVNINSGSAGYLNAYVAENAAEGNSFTTIYTNDSVNANSNTYLEMWIGTTSGLSITYTEEPQYILYDLDVAALSDGEFAFMTVARMNGSGQWGAVNPKINAVNTQGGIGEFRHLTYVLDLTNNDIYVFNNGEQVYYSSRSGFTGDDKFSNFTNGTQWNFNSIRLGSNATASYAWDNVYARHLTGDAAAALSASLSANDFANWSGNVYNGDYVLPEMGAAVSINGVDYASATTASDALTGNNPMDVVVKRAFKDTLVINANATIETNGFDFTYELGEGVTATQEGTVITTVAPYQASAVFTPYYEGTYSGTNWNLNTTDKQALVNALVGSASGNLVNVNNFQGAKMNDFIPYVVSPAGSSDTYVMVNPNTDNSTVDMQFTAMCTETQLTAGTNYYVIDVDLASESQFGNSIYVQPVLRFANGDQGTPFGYGVYLGKHLAANGAWQHVTLVGDMADNALYIFVDGALVDVQHAYNETVSGASAGIASATNLKFQAVKFSNTLGGDYKVSVEDTIYIDGVNARVYADNAAAGDVEAAIAAGNLAGWSNGIAGKEGYVPAVATVNGVDYYSETTASEALAGSEEKDVDICRDIYGTIYVEGNAVIDTHGFDSSFETATEISTIYDGDSYATLVGPYAITEDGDVVTFTEVAEENLNEYTTIGEWTYDYDAYEDFDVVYYAFGQKIEYADWDELDPYTNAVEYGNYLSNDGMLTSFDGWELYDADGNPITEDQYAYEGNPGYYAYGSFASEDGVSIDVDYLYNYSLDTNYVVNIFVPAANAVEGTEVTVGGETYFVVSGLANDIFNDVANVIVPVSANDETYAVQVDASLCEYASAILAGDYSDEMKTLIYATVNYAYAASVEVSNLESSDAFSAILADYSEWAMENKAEYEAVNTDDLTAIIKGAYFASESEICYVFVPNNFGGEITITYESINGTVSETFESDEFIVLSDIKAYDLLSTLTIEGNGVRGTYSFEGYVAGIKAAGDDTTFVEAMYNYAAAARAYKLACLAA